MTDPGAAKDEVCPSCGIAIAFDEACPQCGYGKNSEAVKAKARGAAPTTWVPQRLPSIAEEKSHMLSLGFLIDRWLIEQDKQPSMLSSDVALAERIKATLGEISSATLQRLEALNGERF